MGGFDVSLATWLVVMEKKEWGYLGNDILEEENLMKREKKGREAFNEEREEGNIMMFTTKNKRNQGDSLRFLHSKRSTLPAFRPNELNAVIRAAFREGCVWRGERKS